MHQTKNQKQNQNQQQSQRKGVRNWTPQSLLPFLLLVLTVCSTSSLALPSRNDNLVGNNNIWGGMNVNGRGHQAHFRSPLLEEQHQQDSISSSSHPPIKRSFISNLFKKRDELPRDLQYSSHPLSKRRQSVSPSKFGSSWSSKSRRNRTSSFPAKHNRHQFPFMIKKDTSSSSSSMTDTKNSTCKAKTLKSSNSTSSSSATPSSTSSSSSSAPKSTNGSELNSGSGSSGNHGGSGNSKNGNGMIMAGYWPEWAIGALAPEDIDFTKFDFIDYAFVIPSSSYDLSFSDPSSSPAILKRLVKAAHAGKSKVVISIGGWGGGEYFSPAVGDASSRKTFINNIVAFHKKYNLDGIDIDWEYPNSNAAGNSKTSPSDAANFQTFLGELRTALPSGALLTAAVSHLPFIGSDGSPVGSVARAAEALDYILIMNYDVWGSAAKPGPNAPLADLCGNSTQPTASAAAGVKQWSAAGMPRSKILLGVPSYGYVSKSSSTRLKGRSTPDTEVPSSHPGRFDPRFSAAAFETMRKPSSNGEKRLTTSLLSGTSQSVNKGYVLASTGGTAIKSGDGSTTSGQIQFNQIVAQGGLKSSGGSFKQGTGWSKKWDDCSDTPFLTSGDQVITYDDPDSLYDKAAFSVLSGIAGVNMFSIDGDTKDWTLTQSLINGMADSFN